MPIPGFVARSNRFVANPVLRLVAGWLPGFCILHHVGRRSGKVYSIPLNVFGDGDAFVFALTYGSDTDWVKNVLAAGECVITRFRKEIRLDRPEFISEAEGMAAMPAPVGAMLRLIDVTEFLRMERQPG